VKVDSSDLTKLQSTLSGAAKQAATLEKSLANIRQHLAAIGGAKVPAFTTGGTPTSGSGGGSYSPQVTVPQPPMGTTTQSQLYNSRTVLPGGTVQQNNPYAIGGSGGTPFVNLGGTPAPSGMQRTASYLGQGAGTALSVVDLLGTAGAAALGSNGSNMINRNYLAGQLAQSQGQGATYNNNQASSNQLTQALKGNLGYQDVTQAGAAIQAAGAQQLGGGYSRAVTGSISTLDALNPTAGAATNAQSYNALTSVSGYYAGRRAGINIRPGQNINTIFAQVVKRLAPGGKSNPVWANLATQPGSRLNYDLTTLGFDANMIQEFATWAQQQGGDTGPGLQQNNGLARQANTLAGSQGNRQTQQDIGLQRGAGDAMGVQTDINNGMADFYKTKPGEALTYIQGYSGQIAGQLKGIASDLKKVAEALGGGELLSLLRGSRAASAVSNAASGARAGLPAAASEVGGALASTAVITAPAAAIVGAGLLVNQGFTDATLGRHANQDAGQGQLQAMLQRIQKWQTFTAYPQAKDDFDKNVKPFIDASSSDSKSDAKQAAAMSALQSFFQRYPYKAVSGTGAGDSKAVMAKAALNKAAAAANASSGVTQPNNGPITQHFGNPNPGGPHPGTDFGGALGSSIFAARAGTVTHAGPASGFGNAVVIDHGDVSTLYGHMYNSGLFVKAGDTVKQGQHIANVGSNGNSTGPHLHFEVHPGAAQFGGYAANINPESWLKSNGASIKGQSSAAVPTTGGSSSATSSPNSDSVSPQTSAAGWAGGFGSQDSADALAGFLSGGGGSGPSFSSGGSTSAGSSSSSGGGSSATSGNAPSTMPSGNLAQWEQQALKLLGKPYNQFAAGLTSLIQHESGGNPHAQNNWDSNAKAGHPSKGIMQTIDGTFMEYALPGHTDIWNPVDNIIAGFRYAEKNYGDAMLQAGGRHDAHGNYIGYARGNYEQVKDELARLHKGEMVLQPQEANMLRDMASRSGSGSSSTRHYTVTNGSWNISIASASEDEVRRAVNIWKDEMEREDRVHSMAMGG
jgi:murein DD-endopeptidase MepM/ murein hydrolase activator NlpD